MSKKPKSIVVSFRLSPMVIAKAIDGLKTYDKTASVNKLSQIIKQTTLHGINYLTNALPWEPSEEAQRIVHSLTNQGRETFSIEESILSQKPKPLSNRTKEIQTESKPSESFLGQSQTNVVTDFSIPKDLIDELDDGEEK